MSDIQTTNWSETAANNTASVPNGFPDNQPPSSVKFIVRENMGAIKREYDRSHATATTGGSDPAYTLTYTAAPPAYTNGLRFSFIASFTNTGTASLNVNSLGAITINKQISSGLAVLAAGDIVSGQHCECEYDSGAAVFVLLNPQSLSAGNLPSDLVYNDVETQWVGKQVNAATPYTLTDTTTFVIDWAVTGNSVFINLPGNRTMGAPVNMKAGATYQMFIKQGSGGSKLISAWDTAWDWGDAGAPTLSTTAGLLDWIGGGCAFATSVKAALVGTGYSGTS